MSSKLVFFGNERLVSGLKTTNAPVLRSLIANGYNIVAIVSHHTDARSRSARSLEVAEVAKQYGIPLLLPEKPTDIEKELADLKADAAVLAAYGKIIPQRIIDVFAPLGIINIHPSLLPRHRGPTPIESTILVGDPVAGVSLMQLTAGMDEGPVYAQTSFKLSGNETKQQLYEQLSEEGAKLLIDHLPAILQNELAPKPQNNSDATYTSLISKTDGILDPTTDTANVLQRKVRAYADYPKARLALKNADVILTSAKVTEHTLPGELIVECADNTLLLVEELIAPSGKTMSGSAFLRGYAAA